MHRITVFLIGFALVGCEVKSDKIVGYGMSLDEPLNAKCFTSVFEDIKKKSDYEIDVKVLESDGKVSSYDLTIDGQRHTDDHGIFTRSSFKLAKEFLTVVKEKCTY